MLAVFCVFMASGLFAPRAEAVSVQIGSGGVPQLSVVTKVSPSPRVLAAATSLAGKLSVIIGATVNVTTGDGTTGIAVGLGNDFTAAAWPYKGTFFTPTDPRQTDEYGLRSHSVGVYVGGATEAAVEYAVWDLLYRMGYRQFFPTASWEVIPSNPNLSIDVNVSEHPDYYTRDMSYGYGTWADIAPLTAQWKIRNRIRPGVSLNTTHSYAGIISRNAAAFAAHPEYMALVGGVRQSTGLTSAKFCISNANLRLLVANDALARFAADSNRQSYSVEPSDGGGWCECSFCAALGSISDRQVTLANQVATAVNTAYPNAKYIGMYAYGQHSPPPTISVNSRIVVSIATHYIEGGYTHDQLLSGWAAKGANLGIREYYSVNVWDRDLPGKSDVSDLTYLETSIPHFYSANARFSLGETSDAWGPSGLGHYIASRYLWDTQDVAFASTLVDDFLTKSFGAAKPSMTDFYNLINGANNPLLSPDLLGRMFGKLSAGLGSTADPKIRRRMYDLALYTRYCELYRAYSIATGTARQTAFEALIRFAYRIHPTMMVHSQGLYRDLPARDATVTVPSDAEWNDPEPGNPWKSTTAYTDAEIDTMISNGITNNPLLTFTPVAFSDDLVPITPLALSGTGGTYNYLRNENSVHTWFGSAPGQSNIVAKGGLVYTNKGNLNIKFYPREEPLGGYVDSDTSVVPNGTNYNVSLDTTYTGAHAITVNDGTGGFVVTPSTSGTPFTFEVSLDKPAQFYGRWTMYFYVPKGTTTVGGYSWGGANDGTDKLLDGAGATRLTFNSTPAYWSVSVPTGQDGKLWQFKLANSRRALMTVPPYVARQATELLLPRDVVEDDTP
jgi:hypothetical protein